MENITFCSRYERSDSFIISLASKLGISSLRFIQDVWKDIFSSRDLEKLLIELKKDIVHVKPANKLPTPVSELVVQYFE